MYLKSSQEYDNMNCCYHLFPATTVVLEQERIHRGALRDRSRLRRKKRRTRSFLQMSRSVIPLIVVLCATAFVQSTYGLHLAANVKAGRTLIGRIDWGANNIMARQMIATVAEPEPEAPETSRGTSRVDSDTSQPSSATAFGQWEEVEGNFILRPSIEDGPPRALGTCDVLCDAVNKLYRSRMEAVLSCVKIFFCPSLPHIQARLRSLFSSSAFSWWCLGWGKY